MDYAKTLEAINAMDIDDRVLLAHEILKGVEAETEQTELSDEMKAELDRRIAESEAHPERALPFEEVFRRAKARWKK